MAPMNPVRQLAPWLSKKAQPLPVRPPSPTSRQQSAWWKSPLAQNLPFYLVLAVVVLLPLLVLPLGWFWKPTNLRQYWPIAYETYQLVPRIVFLLAVGSIGTLLLWLQQPRSFWRKPFVVLMLVYLGLVLISSALTRDDLSRYVIWGGLLRMDGVLYQIGLVMVGILAYASVNAQNLPRLLTYFVLAGAVQGLLMLGQVLGIDPLGQGLRWGSSKIALGSLAHPGMAAGMLLCSVATGLGLLGQYPRSPLLWTGVLLSALGLGLADNLTSALVAVVVLLGLVITQRSWAVLLASLLSVGLLLGISREFSRVLFQTEQIQESQPRFVAETPEDTPNSPGVVDRLLENRTLQTRQYIWSIAFWSVGQTPGQPLVGAGPDGLKLTVLRNPPTDLLVPLFALEENWPTNYTVVQAFRNYREGSPVRSTSVTVQFSEFGNRTNVARRLALSLDKAHNLFLDRWVNFGLGAALIWLALILIPAWRGWLRLRSLEGALAWACLGLFGFYLFWFSVVQVEPLHLILLAASWSLLVQYAPRAPKTTQTVRASK